MNKLNKILRVILLASLFISLPSFSFTFKDSANKTHSLEQYKGKWVLVNFWATWCPPCLAEIPDFIDLYKQNPNKIMILGIAMDYKNPQDVLNFAKDHKINYPIILGNRQIASQVGSVSMFPTSYLYNPEGKLVSYQVGILSKRGIESYIKNREKK